MDKTGQRTFEVLQERLKIFGRSKLVTADIREIELYRSLPVVQHCHHEPSHLSNDFVNYVILLTRVFINENAGLIQKLPKKIRDLCDQCGK